MKFLIALLHSININQLASIASSPMQTTDGVGYETGYAYNLSGAMVVIQCKV